MLILGYNEVCMPKGLDVVFYLSGSKRTLSQSALERRGVAPSLSGYPFPVREDQIVLELSVIIQIENNDEGKQIRKR